MVGENEEFADINGRRYAIRRLSSRNRTASAKLRDGTITLSIPSRWPNSEKERIASNLLRRAIKAIGDGRWSDSQSSRVVFSHGQTVMALGRPLQIVFIPSKRFRSRLRENRVEVGVVEGHPELGSIAARLARKSIVRDAMPRVVEQVKALNDAHFQAQVPRVSIRDNTSRWGSCSADGSISLNFRLLFMPQDILQYVIVHELAHTKYRSHGPRFWALVERIIPDHKEKRKWLRIHGWTVPGGEGGRGQNAGQSPQPAGQSTLADYTDEPY